MTPFFIVGAGRSGTTLLQQVLSRHSRMIVTPETHYLNRIRLYDDRTDGGFQLFWEELRGWQRFQDLSVASEKVLARVDRIGERNFRAVFLAMLEEYGDKHGKAHVGEKTPGHVRHLPKILNWFPNTRIIALRRDPRAVIASHLRSPWVTDQMNARQLTAPLLARLRQFHLVDRARLWADAYGTRLKCAHADTRFFHLTYEALVTETEVTIRDVCSHLEEPFEASLLDPASDPGAVTTKGPKGWEDWVSGHEAKARSAVTASNLERWTEQLSEQDIALIEAVCGNEMEEFGYSLQASSAARSRAGARAKALMAAGDLEDFVRRSSGRRLRRAEGFQASVRPFVRTGSSYRAMPLPLMDQAES